MTVSVTARDSRDFVLNGRANQASAIRRLCKGILGPLRNLHVPFLRLFCSVGALRYGSAGAPRVNLSSDDHLTYSEAEGIRCFNTPEWTVYGRQQAVPKKAMRSSVQLGLVAT